MKQRPVLTPLGTDIRKLEEYLQNEAAKGDVTCLGILLTGCSGIRIGEMCIRDSLIGPAPAFIGRINDIFRYVLYIKNPDYDILIRLKNRMERFLKELERKDENVQFDFDPMSSF